MNDQELIDRLNWIRQHQLIGATAYAQSMVASLIKDLGGTPCNQEEEDEI